MLRLISYKSRFYCDVGAENRPVFFWRVHLFMAHSEGMGRCVTSTGSHCSTWSLGNSETNFGEKKNPLGKEEPQAAEEER